MPAVTQLFTEDYMVEFLLHNAVGAWWAGKQGPVRAETEEQAHAAVALPERDGLPAITWGYLRFIQDEDGTWRPAAGSFDGWPRHAAEIRFLDPCMGSGHFLVFALPILARLRMEEELGAAEAVAAVLRDNLHGLEIDERCTQIAAFNVALTAWKLGGYQALPALHLACSGLAPHASKQAWMDLADRAADFIDVPPEGDLFGAEDNLFSAPLHAGMERLYDLFRQAPVLGSLIDPRAIGGDMLTADFQQLQPILEQALARETNDNRRELAVTAQGLTKASEVLGGRFTLVATNVPYLARGKQSEALKRHCETHYPEAKNDLANCFMERCIAFVERGPPAPAAGPGRPGSYGTVQLVMPQNWLFLTSYRKQRERLLRDIRWNLVARLGPGAFETISGEVVNAILLSISNAVAPSGLMLSGIDASTSGAIEDKTAELRGGTLVQVSQKGQFENPDCRLSLDEPSAVPLLSRLADSYQGITTGDNPRFICFFWEVSERSKDWITLQSTGESTTDYEGRQQFFYWQNGLGELARSEAARIQGQAAWGSKGVAVRQMGELAATISSGSAWDMNTAMVVPREASNLQAIWCFCSSPALQEAVRRIDKKLNVTNATLVKVPFDLAQWKEIAAEKYPNGLPKPHSDDPTQWLFNGHPKDSEQPFQVAVARLLGYRWPRQTGSEFPDCPALGPDGLEDLADADGIVCLPPINKEQPAAARLRNLLAAAFGADWSPSRERNLLAATGARQTNLEDWLRDAFFEQHLKLFKNRPQPFQGVISALEQPGC